MEDMNKIHETSESLERSNLIKTWELPASHIEGVRNLSAELNGDTREAHLAMEKFVGSVADGLYDSYIESSPGLLKGFTELSGSGDGNVKDAFHDAYREYVLDPESLKDKSPTMYTFLCDRVFCGREFQKKHEDNEDDLKKPIGEEVTGPLAKHVMYKYDMGSRLPDGCNSTAREGINVRCD